MPGKAIFYSLGNFIFDTDYQRVHRYTDTSVLLKLSFTEDSFSFEAIGTGPFIIYLVFRGLLFHELSDEIVPGYSRA